MNIADILSDKSIRPKEKTEKLSVMILDGDLPVAALIDFAAAAKDPVKATCIEAMEYATSRQPEIANGAMLQFATEGLSAKAPRIKWESAKLTGNIAHLFPDELDTAITHLLDNTTHNGTVVRWSAAFALGEIAKLNTKHNRTLLPALENIAAAEEKNSIKKIYLAAFKKLAR